MSTERETLFQEKADTYQSGQYRTKPVGLRTSLSVLGIRVLGLIASVIVYLVAREAFGLVWYVGPLVIGLFALGILATLGWTVVNFVRPTKVITCPRCGSEHRLYKSVRKYMCTECRALLLLGRDADIMPCLSPCPYCGLETAVSDDHGRFICPNCGVIREDGVMGGEAAPRACPDCRQIVPQRLRGCPEERLPIARIWRPCPQVRRGLEDRKGPGWASSLRSSLFEGHPPRHSGRDRHQKGAGVARCPGRRLRLAGRDFAGA